MTSFAVVEAKPYHCGQMARLLRRAHRRAVLAIGADVHREMRARFDASCVRRAWLIDGALAGIGGIVGSFAASEGFIWLALAEDALRYPVAMVKEARRQLVDMMRIKRRLTTSIVRGDEASMRFAVALGFNVCHPLPFGDDPLVSLEINLGTWQQPVLRPGAVLAPFIVYTAGRSRTAWLAAFLTYGAARCHNEVAVRFRDMDEVAQFFAPPGTGSAETGIAPGWRLLAHAVPDLRTVVVRRPVEEIIASFHRLLPVDEDRLRRIMAYQVRCLDQISAEPGVLTVDFADLHRRETCVAVFEHCLPYRFDEAWWTSMRHRNVQADVADLLRYYAGNIEGVAAFKRAAKRRLAQLARAGQMRSA